MSDLTTETVVAFVERELAAAANPEKAEDMQAYMRTEMPFYGATHLVRPLVIEYPDDLWPEVDTWIDHDDMWLRRAAIICQVGAKERTDTERLFRYCEKRAHEKEFFIRKATGWGLRDYARTEPEAVARFVDEHREELSGLSYREATKHIDHLVAS